MVYLLIILGSLLAVFWKKIDFLGGVVGCLTTILLYHSIGLSGIAFIAAFFLLGSLASVYRLNEKSQHDLAEAKQGQRGWKNVVANSGAAASVAIVHLILPDHIENSEIAIAVCFATALSDTLSSEMGNLTGKKHFSILTTKPAIRGQDGAVSWSGFAWGLLGSSLMGVIYGLFFEFDGIVIGIILLGFVGNMLDSFFGATLQSQGKLSNNGVNLLSTSCITILALVFTLGPG